MTAACRHNVTWEGSTGVVACASCGAVEWWSDGRPLDAAEGMARLFGRFELVSTMPSLHAPAPDILAYRPPSRRARARLGAFPIHQWLLVSDGLWLTHDGTLLLLCPTDPVLASNMWSGVETSPQEVGTR
ncbi:MAG: hypothetical protein P1T08_06015 [Acidimicrobiia bacterium]|nr:hypothetical protein [Acidimicrobiia bacterium]